MSGTPDVRAGDSPSALTAGPSGPPPPEAVTTTDGSRLALQPLAAEVCRRFRAEFPDYEDRYGEAAVPWCVFDNQYLLCWAVLATRDYLDFSDKVSWLAQVLEARAFPLDQLARSLDIAAVVVDEQTRSGWAKAVSAELRTGARLVRSRDTFLDGT